MITEVRKEKKVWNAPTLKVHGTVEQITQVVKTLGHSDGVFFDPDGPGPAAPVAIGPWGS